MIWADRFGVVWMIAVVILVLATGPAESNGTVVFWVIVAPWLLMRGLDWILSGEFRHHFIWPR